MMEPMRAMIMPLWSMNQSFPQKRVFLKPTLMMRVASMMATSRMASNWKEKIKITGPRHELMMLSDLYLSMRRL